MHGQAGSSAFLPNLANMTGSGGDELDTRRVLLVDDAPDLRTLLQVALERDGRFVVVGEAVNGAEAIDKAADLQPDIVVLDQMMPVMSGLEAMPHIRRAAPEAKIVLFSAIADRLEFNGSVPDLVMVKGGTMKSVVEAIAEV